MDENIQSGFQEPHSGIRRRQQGLGVPRALVVLLIATVDRYGRFDGHRRPHVCQVIHRTTVRSTMAILIKVLTING